MKYKFTGKTKKYLGITLNQIICVTAFSNVSVGDIGGWIENEENLSHNSDAWVSDNARVFGDAWATLRVLTIDSGIYHVTITDNHIKIGCQQKTIKEWKSMTCKQVDEIERGMGIVWRKSKSFIMFLAERNEE